MASPKLKAPLRRHLSDTLPESHLYRMWRGIESSRGLRVSSGRRPLIAAVAMLTLCACIALMLLLRKPGALRLTDGADVPSTLVADTARSLSFEDGSHLDASPDTRLDVLESTGRSFTVALRRGSVSLDVVPGGPRVFRVESGPVTIEVVGTHFGVSRNASGVRVHVERGAVLVRGEGVPDRVARLSGGQSIFVSSAPEGRETTPPVPFDSLQAALPVPENPVASAAPAEIEAPVHEGASSSDPPRAPPAALPSAELRQRSTAVALLARSDALRREGRAAEAARTLETLLAEPENDSQAAVADFTLGRLYLDSLGKPGPGALHFARALAKGLPKTLEEDAHARLVEALARSGQPDAARDAAARYRARFPEGHRLADVNRWAPTSE